MVDKASLNLLSSLAQQSPLSLIQAKGSHLPSLLQITISSLDQQVNENNNNMTSHNIVHHLQCVQSILEAMNNISIALDLPQSSLSDNPKERMVQLIQIMTMTESNNKDPKKLTIQPNSNAASIGKVCLQPLLTLFISILQTTVTLAPNSFVEDMIQNAMQVFSQIASTCPSLLVGHNDMTLITMLLNTFLYIGENTKLSDPNVRLSALEALVTLFMVPDMTKLIMENEMIRKLCLLGRQQNGGGVSGGGVSGSGLSYGGIVGVCAELLVKGVDEDVETWAIDDVALQVSLQHTN